MMNEDFAEVMVAVMLSGLALLILWLIARLFLFILGGQIQRNRNRKTSASENAAKVNLNYISTAQLVSAPILETVLKKTFIRLAPHFSFQGTATRKQFLLTQVVIGIILGFARGIGSSMFASWSDFIRLLGILLIIVAVCVTCWVAWAVSARRVRDTGVTVWRVLTLLVPPLNLATFVFMLLVPTNEFQGRSL